ncbi:hypothetical protein TrispH2_012096 [Trichoplax sp. H2]|nr:hypothetical protein TrispH2_012096 [Trichoplax sp. H2]|eukprot:RDD35823.1 hypothetical protein TrispH2_012096 [Trichoplax sp. H2]
MVLSKYITNVIDKEYPQILSDVPLVDIVFDLRSIGLISDDEVDKLKDGCQSKKERIFHFIKILKSRSDDNYFQFCCILKDSQVTHIKNLGRKLEIEANASRNEREHSRNPNQAANYQHQPKKKNPILRPFRTIMSKLFGMKASSYTSSLPIGMFFKVININNSLFII